jgi:hypothetical protein
LRLASFRVILYPMGLPRGRAAMAVFGGRAGMIRQRDDALPF